MGQQQLLLLVLGIVIVGIAVVAGIQAFSEGKTKAENDAVAAEAMRYASDIQAWKLKPGAFGGGASDSLNTVTWGKIGITNLTNGQYKTANACYELANNGAGKDIVGYVLTDGCTSESEIGTVEVTGTGTDGVTWVPGSR